MKAKVYLLGVLLLALDACSLSGSGGGQAVVGDSTDSSAAEAQHYAPAQIGRIDLLTLDFDNQPATYRDSMVGAMRPGIDLYLRLVGGGDDVEAGLSAISATAPVEIFGPDVKARLSDLSGVEVQLGQVVGSINERFPKAHISGIYGVISPYRQGVVTSDSIMLVVTNLYLGVDYPGYKGFDEYFRSTRISERIPYDVAEGALAAGYPFEETEGATVLNRMLYHGALVHDVMTSMTHPDEAMAIGVDDDQLAWLRKNLGNIWRALIDRNLLYSTTPLDADRLVSPAGSSPWLHPEAPGRIGRFVGLEIVMAYLMKHPDTDPAWLLTPDFYNSNGVLAEAAFNPQ